MGIVSTYVHLLKTYPFVTKVTSGASLVGFGDIMAQNFIEKTPVWDKSRTMRFAGIALFVITPLTRSWVDLMLPKLVPNAARTTQFALKKLAYDLTLFVTFGQTLLVGLNMSLSGEVTTNEFMKKMQSEQPEIIKYAWCYWGPLQFVNFKWVPVHLQASYIQVIALFWNTFLSWKAHDNLKMTVEPLKNAVKKDLSKEL